MRPVASTSRAILSASGTVKGSTSIGVSHRVTAGFTGESATGATRNRAEARATRAASVAQRSASVVEGSALAAKPHAPSTSTRTPSPSVPDSWSADTRRFFTSRSWVRDSTRRTSA